jgi:hypothetical protein
MTLLTELKTLALRHNRDYYISMIPFIEKSVPEDSDLIEMYQIAIDEDRTKLMQSRQALEGVTKMADILSL